MRAERAEPDILWSLAALHQTGELVRVLAALEQAGITAVSLKGPILALRAYGSLAARRFRDLDIWVPESSVARALTVLRELGYAETEQYRGLSITQLTRSGYHVQMVHEGGLVLVEVHWRLLPSGFGLQAAENAIRDRCVPVAVGGHRVRALCPADSILFQAAHGGKHRWSRDEWITSFVAFVRRHPHIDWHALRGEARRLGVLRMLCVAIALGRVRQGLAVPRALADDVHSEAVRRLVAAIHAHTAPHGSLRSLRLVARMRERGRDRARHWFHRIGRPNAADVQLIALPRWAFLLYYPVRVLRLVATVPTRLARRRAVTT